MEGGYEEEGREREKERDRGEKGEKDISSNEKHPKCQ